MNGMRTALGAAVLASILLPGRAGAQYNLTTLFLDGAQIPNSSITWDVNTGNDPTMPLSIQGGNIAFVQCGSPSGGCGPDSPDDGVWVEDFSASPPAFTHLVAPGDTAPGTGGVTFTNFGGYALLAGNWVVFLAPEGAANGLYSVNITSKTIVRLANQATNLPGLGTAATFTYGNNTSYLPQSDGSLVVFQATSPEGAAIYSVAPNGQNLTELAGPNHLSALRETAAARSSITRSRAWWGQTLLFSALPTEGSTSYFKRPSQAFRPGQHARPTATSHTVHWWHMIRRCPTQECFWFTFPSSRSTTKTPTSPPVAPAKMPYMRCP
jgi:hypothetical protein